MTDRGPNSTLTGLVIARIAFAEVVGTINNSPVIGGAENLAWAIENGPHKR